jgi:hypothetical protein
MATATPNAMLFAAHLYCRQLEFPVSFINKPILWDQLSKITYFSLMCITHYLHNSNIYSYVTQ